MEDDMASMKKTNRGENRYWQRREEIEEAYLEKRK